MSLLTIVQGWFSNDLLVEIRENQLRVSSFSGDELFDENPLIAIEKIQEKSMILEIGSKAASITGVNVEVVNPFSHPRLMISNFTYAEKVLLHAIRSLFAARFFAPSPRVIIHQLEKNEGGLTEVEERVLRELALGAGAREVVVYSGSKVNTKIETYDAIKAKSTET